MIMNGGVAPMVMAAVKLGAFYYGAMFLIAYGLAGWSGCILGGRAASVPTEVV